MYIYFRPAHARNMYSKPPAFGHVEDVVWVWPTSYHRMSFCALPAVTWYVAYLYAWTWNPGHGHHHNECKSWETLKTSCVRFYCNSSVLSEVNVLLSTGTSKAWWVLTPRSGSHRPEQCCWTQIASVSTNSVKKLLIAYKMLFVAYGATNSL